MFTCFNHTRLWSWLYSLCSYCWSSKRLFRSFDNHSLSTFQYLLRPCNCLYSPSSICQVWGRKWLKIQSWWPERSPMQLDIYQLRTSWLRDRTRRARMMNPTPTGIEVHQWLTIQLKIVRRDRKWNFVNFMKFYEFGYHPEFAFLSKIQYGDKLFFEFPFWIMTVGKKYPIKNHYAQICYRMS